MSDTKTVRYEKVLEAGQIALKFIVLINGGAAVALLAFIGSIWSPHRIELLTIIFLASGLGAFSLGVLFGAIAAAAAFHAGLHSITDDLDTTDKYAVRAMRSGAMSLLLFLIGICATITAIIVQFYCRA